MLRASNVGLRGDGLLGVRSSMCGVPTRLQSVLGVPELLLNRVPVACVRMDGVQGVSAHTSCILLRVHLVARVKQYCLRLQLRLVSFLFLTLTLLHLQTLPTFRPCLLLLFKKILIDLVC